MHAADDSAAVSLAAALRSATPDELSALLLARRDLATPPPPDSTVLATRASTPGSVARACDELDSATLATLEALLRLGADTTPVELSDVASVLGVDAATSVERLCALAIAWDAGNAIAVVPAARDVVGPYPAGLGRPLPALDDVDLDAALAEVTEEERSLLDTLAAGPPIGTSRDAAIDIPLAEAKTPVQRLLARGLLMRRDATTVELPRQLGVHLRGGRVFAASTLTPPSLATREHGADTVDKTAAGEAMSLLRHVGDVLESWGQEPPSVLKAGGLGVREIRRMMREFDVDEPRAVLLAELVVGAGLAAESNEEDAAWVPTTLTDTWLAAPPSGQWALLADTWLALPRLPGLAYGTAAGRQADTAVKGAATGASSADKPPTPLSERLRRPLAPESRRRVLRALAELPPGTGVETESLVEYLAWQAPRRGGKLRDELVRWTLSEASALGLVALGAATTAARALLVDSETESDEDHRGRAADAMAEAMPDPVDHVLVQADLTVVAPGPLEPDLATEINAVADAESTGHATVYRVSETSVRRALDTGRTATELHELFASRSATPVPQSLTYLIDDVARRHGKLRGGTCASFLRCDDEALLAEVLAGPAATELGLRAIAPTVVVSDLPLGDVMTGLRERGFTPAAEGPDGRVIDLRQRGRRIPARKRVAGSPHTSGTRQIAGVVERIKAGDRAAASRHGASVRNDAGTGDTSATLALLSEAARGGRQVWIGLVDAHGTATQRVVTPVRLSGGVLEGSSAERYPLHRITSAALVDD
ncbi:helicase-associated domain-containing protein [Haloechinothrix salitolerans]|uniref:Helicase-associated domain-containing protein n=1 Tax=Haloechinothrix salitolerans TaxID=926830 RepID=A0ABW2BW68_9PSEU